MLTGSWTAGCPRDPRSFPRTASTVGGGSVSRRRSSRLRARLVAVALVAVAVGAVALVVVALPSVDPPRAQQGSAADREDAVTQPAAPASIRSTPEQRAQLLQTSMAFIRTS